MKDIDELPDYDNPEWYRDHIDVNVRNAYEVGQDQGAQKVLAALKTIHRDVIEAQL